MNQSISPLYTLVTGSSSGIGRAIALECAQRKMNLLIVSLPGPELADTVAYLKRHFEINVDQLAVDLTQPDGPCRVFNWIKSRNYRVNILVNNAGLAGTSRFTVSELSYSDQRIQLNIRALVLLTRLLLPQMLELDKAYILNTGSFSAFFPIGYKAVYAASKAFVLSFSLALKEELRNQPVSITVICPNGVRTRDDTHARIESHGWRGRACEVSAERIARLAVRGMLKGKTLIIPGAFNILVYVISRLLPLGVRTNLATREIRNELFES